MTDLYKFYNLGVDPLPVPPNPIRLKAFYYAVAQFLVELEAPEEDDLEKMRQDHLKFKGRPRVP